MNRLIYIKKNGLFVKSRGGYEEITQPLSYYLHHTPKFENGLTVLDLMGILKNHKAEVDAAFLAYTRGFDFGPFYNEIQSELQQEIDEPIDCLLFSWQTDIHNFKEFGKPLFEISEYVHVTGKKGNDRENYGIAFSNLSRLKNATFKLRTNIEYSTIHLGEIWEDKKPVKQVFLKGIKEFNFENIIGAFLNEISFFGYPEDRDQQFSKLKVQCEEKETGNFTPFEKIQLEWKEKRLSELQNQKETKSKKLKIEKLQKEIAYLNSRLIKIEDGRD